jgi:hypothetical protein
MRRTHHRRLRAALLATLALATAAAMAWPAAAAPSTSTPEQWLPVTLCTHSFGHLRTPDATAATAGPDQVGFYRPPPGVDGSSGGPKSFDLPRDGSIWLSDHVKDQLLVWQPSRSVRPVRSVTLSGLAGDFAVAGDGTIYLTQAVKDQGVPGMDYHLDLAALSPTGQIHWRGHTIMDYANAALRFGPDGALSWAQAGEHVWTQLTTPAGRLLTIAEQRRQTRPGQPLAGGRRLLVTKISNHDWRVVLLDPTGRAVRGWRITSQTELWSIDATPALVGGDPVLVLSAVRQPTTGRLLWESLVLRLAPNGGTRLRFPIAPTDRVVWGDPAWSGLRVGPDGQLYQLRTNPAWGSGSSAGPCNPKRPARRPRPAPPAGLYHRRP